MLHARELSFFHPRRKKLMTFEAPLPEDFLAALKLLRVKNEADNAKYAKDANRLFRVLFPLRP